ncbi:hemolysin [Thermaurantimonas aggregans]|uniref:Hemolysin n=1 Tax=Thermaurantimonas aggregans TaxID=2173829 RepID=A0A401XLP5_9FLAO|nr:hemolysin family protein [Thermaurantimonas aggregans]MCX8147830.1 hemolysin family protein [Thermaurantimonas aggregans]GCD77920.1 hemolysin [Thermaurantimonas aggregans]
MSAYTFVIVSLLLSALFSGLEIAFLSADRFFVEVEQKKGSFAFKIVSFLSRKQGMLLAALLLGNNIALVLYGIFIPDLLSPLFAGIPAGYTLLALQSIVSTFIILVLAEFLPKSVFQSRPHTMLQRFAVFAWLFYILLWPFTYVLVKFSNGILRLLFKKHHIENEENILFTRHDLAHFFKEKYENSTTAAREENEIEIFKNAIQMETRRLREFIIPRTELIALPITAGIQELKKLFEESNLSKILIYRGTIDNLLGYVHVYDLINAPKDITSILRPIRFVPESMTASEVLRLMTKENRSILAVYDEFGALSGIVTIEDVVEELFGDIEDEHDTAENDNQEIVEDGKDIVASGRVEINRLNEVYEMHLPEDENYSTLSGLIFHRLERIPNAGELVEIEGYKLKIEHIEQTRIQKVRILEAIK